MTKKYPNFNNFYSFFVEFINKKNLAQPLKKDYF